MIFTILWVALITPPLVKMTDYTYIYHSISEHGPNDYDLALLFFENNKTKYKYCVTEKSWFTTTGWAREHVIKMTFIRGLIELVTSGYNQYSETRCKNVTEECAHVEANMVYKERIKTIAYCKSTKSSDSIFEMYKLMVSRTNSYSKE